MLSVTSTCPPAMFNAVANLPIWKVKFNKPSRVVKASPYMYSEALNKVYVQDNQPCPVTFRFNIPIDELGNYNLRSWVAFTEKGLVDTVKVCSVEGHKDSNPGQGILRYECDGTLYQLHQSHESAVINLSKLRVDNDRGFGDDEDQWPVGADVNYKFLCLSSCHSISRRKMKMVITLEDSSSGHERARLDVNLKICKCPGRDCQNEERPKSRAKSTKRKSNEDHSASSSSDELDEAVVHLLPAIAKKQKTIDGSPNVSSPGKAATIEWLQKMTVKVEDFNSRTGAEASRSGQEFQANDDVMKLIRTLLESGSWQPGEPTTFPFTK